VTDGPEAKNDGSAQNPLLTIPCAAELAQPGDTVTVHEGIWRGKLRAGRLNPWEESAIATDRVTLPKMLKTKGYSTACVGKWHLGFDWPWKSSPRNTLNTRKGMENILATKKPARPSVNAG
jgi:hypothetical protein